jgi:hypothetical protein
MASLDAAPSEHQAMNPIDSIVNPPPMEEEDQDHYSVDEGSSSPAPPSPEDNEDEETLILTLHHHSVPHTITLPSSSTIADLSTYISTSLLIPPSHQKLLIAPKPGLLRPPFPPTPLAPILSSPKLKLTLLGSTPSEISTLDASISKAVHLRRSNIHSARPTTHRLTPAQAHARNEYTFHTLRPLPHLPNPSRSTAFLTRLRDDPGIRTAMQNHRFSVPLLTEMDPAEHTTHESRTLGLNRNRGEVIELRLRTDAYDGYRDYKTIRKTLCHELAHNVWGEHDSNFWKLTREIEKEVEKADWTRGGRSVGREEFYDPGDNGEEEHVDGGGWTGGEFVLGGQDNRGLSRREILARAAEERLKSERGKGRERSREEREGEGA